MNNEAPVKFEQMQAAKDLSYRFSRELDDALRSDAFVSHVCLQGVKNLQSLPEFAEGVTEDELQPTCDFINGLISQLGMLRLFLRGEVAILPVNERGEQGFRLTPRGMEHGRKISDIK